LKLCRTIPLSLLFLGDTGFTFKSVKQLSPMITITALNYHASN
jgi:hypothetical protein